jgi:hypothetical protein
MRTEYEANDEADGCSDVRLQCIIIVCMRHTSTHHATHLHCALLAGLLQVANGCFIRLSSVDGPRAPCGMDETGTGILIATL